MGCVFRMCEEELTTNGNSIVDRSYVGALIASKYLRWVFECFMAKHLKSLKFITFFKLRDSSSKEIFLVG